jgi:hypothetical protein
METTTYTALCERAGRWWTIRIPQVDGLTAQVRNLEQAEMMTRQTIVRSLGVPPESVVVEVIPEAPVAVANALEARHAARQALEVAVQATIQALDTLAQDGHSFEDAAVMLGLSPTEVAQYGPGTGMAPGDQVRSSGPLEMVKH